MSIALLSNEDITPRVITQDYWVPLHSMKLSEATDYLAGSSLLGLLHTSTWRNNELKGNDVKLYKTPQSKYNFIFTIFYAYDMTLSPRPAST